MNRPWRVCATGLAFAIFGLGGVVLPATVFPAIWLSSRGRRRREQRAKAAVHYSMRGFMEVMRGLGILTYSVDNPQRFRRSAGQLILANHPTLIDVVFLLAFVRNGDCVVKSSLLRNPFTRGPIGMAGYIGNENPEQVVEATIDSLARGNSLIIFPEGTRTTPAKRAKLHRGAANIALRAGVPVTPVIIHCEPVTLTKETPWYKVPPRRFHMDMRMEADIGLKPFVAEGRTTLAARKLTRFLEDYYNRELPAHERSEARTERPNH